MVSCICLTSIGQAIGGCSDFACVLRPGQGFEPISDLGEAAFACIGAGSFPLFIDVMGIGAVGDEEFCEVFAIGGGCGKERGVAADLGGIGGGAVVEQHGNRFWIAAEGKGSVQG